MGKTFASRAMSAIRTPLSSPPLARTATRLTVRLGPGRDTTQDLSQPYLDAAAAEAKRRGIEIETVRADMRAPGFDGRFDAVINMFSSFGYLESEAEDAKVLRGVAAALRPSGRALFDLINREWVIRNQVANESRTGANETVDLEHRELDLVTSRNHVTFTAVAPDGSRHDLDGHHIRLYTLTELIGMLEAAGLRLERVYGGVDGEGYGGETRRRIFVAAQPRRPPP